MVEGPPPMSMGGVRRSDILPAAENEVPNWAKSLPEFAQPLFAEGEQKNLDAWRERVAYEMRPGASSMEMTRPVSQDDIERVALNRWEQSGRQGPKKDVGQMVAGLAGFADLATLGLSDEYAALAPAAEKLIETGSIGQAADVFADRRRDMQSLLSNATQQRPFSLRAGQTAALAPGGAKLFTNVALQAPRMVAPSVAARFAGSSAAARTGRFAGRGAALAGASALDYYGYNYLAEAPNQARLSGTEMPGMGERAEFAGREAFTPGGAVAAALGPIGSVAARTVRAPLAATKNLVTTGSATTRAVPGGGRQQVPVANLFTPADVQRRVDGFYGGLSTMSRTDAERAIDMLLKRGFDPDEAEKMVKFLDYAGKSEVPEMLFQVMPNLRKVDQLTVALGTVGGDAQKALGDALSKQGRESPGILRDALRKAMGISGADYYGMSKGLRADQFSKPKAGYEAAYGKEVADDTWQNRILPQLRTKYGREAVAEAADYAEGIAGTDPAQLAVARQLAELRDALGSQGATPGKVSTQSLDYIDRMLGDMAQGLNVGKGRKELAKGPAGAQRTIRGDANSGLDVETGLGDPRRLSGELKTAQEAMVFGRTAYRDGTDIETLLDEFADDIARRGVDGGESEIINGALLMGWLRGAEDDISRATNPQSVIRRLYGSERQRDKLLAMMPELADDAGSGFKGSNTKDIRALVGGRREDGRQMDGMIDRLRRLSGDYNRIIGNAQTAQRGAAVAEQSGLSQKLNMALDAMLSPARAAVDLTKAGINYATRPGIYDEGVNRELGRILTTRGKKQLLKVIAEIRARKLARDSGSNTAPPTGPRPPPAGPGSGSGAAAKPTNSRSGYATDVAALGAIGLAPTASAQTQDGSAELQVANHRVEAAIQRVADVDRKIAKLESDLLLLEDPSADPKKIQTLLANRDFDLGPRGVDGIIGDDTRKAIGANVREIKAEIAYEREQREGATAEVEAARKGVTQAEMLQIQRQNEPGSTSLFMQAWAPLAGVVAGGGLAYIGRRGAVRNAGVSATNAAQRADDLVNTNPVNRRSPKGPDGIDTRAPRLNQFFDEGRELANVPFESKVRGGWKTKPNADDPQSLYRPPNQRTVSGFLGSRIRSPDVGWTAAGVAEGKIMEGLRKGEEEKIRKAEADIERHFKSGDRVAYNDALQRRNNAKNLYATYYFLERLGYGYAVTRVGALLKSPYQHVRPDISRAERELKLLRDDIAKK